MTLKFETKNSNKRSIWSKIREILLYSVSIYFVLFLLIIGTKYVRDGTFTLLEDAVSSIMFFLLTAYWRIIELEKCIGKVFQTFSPRLQKAARTFRFWFYAFAVWFASLLIRVLLLPQFLRIDFSFFDTLLVYMLYPLFFSLCIFSLIVYVPSGQYLSLPQIEAEERKKVANALTVLTPALGFPWLIAVSLVLPLANIQVEPYWLIYTMFISIYVTLYVLFVDLPYCVNMRGIKKQEMDKLEKERNGMLEKLRKIDDDKQKSLLKKIVLESEITRIDREKQEIKSQSIHPYKVVIPFASFFLGIFGAIFIEFIKNVFQLA